MIGIIGAMDKEIDDLKAVMTDVEMEKISSMEFWKGKLSGKDVVLVRSGVGKVNAATAAEVLCALYKCDKVMNTGIAGSLDARIDIGDVVLATDALQHDMDVSGLGYDLGVIPDIDCSIFTADAELRKVAKEVAAEYLTDIKVFEGRVVSGDQFVSSREKKDFIKNTFDGMCTEMEGASIAQVCYLNQVPYLVIRSISDKADDSADMDYPSFQKKAIKNSVLLVTKLMERL